MRVPIFVHQFDRAYDGSALPSDDSTLPFAELWAKTNDGLQWQATWDTHPAAIAGLRGVGRLAREVYAPQGIALRPWGVVHGRWPGTTDYAAEEARLAAAIARAAAAPGQPAVYIVDLEPHYHAPFPAFWRDDLGAGPDDARAYVEAFAAAGGEQLWLCPDAREPHLRAVSFAGWLHPAVTRVVPQVYFTDFVRPREPTHDDVTRALEEAVTTLAARGWRDRSSVHPALPGDAPPALMQHAIREAHRLGCGGVSVWQRATLRLDTASAIAELLDPWAAPPTPPTPHIDRAMLRERLHAVRAAVDAVEQLL